MQIYEVTQRPVQEGLLGDIGRGLVSAAGGPDLPQSPGSAAKSAATSAAALSKQGYGPGGPAPDSKLATALSTDWKVKLQNIEKDPAIAQYLNSLLQGWSKQAEKLNAAQATVQPQPEPATAQPQQAQTQPPNPTVKPTYGKPSEPVVSFAGQRQRPLDPKNPSDAKIIAQLKKQGQLHEVAYDPKKVQAAKAARRAGNNPASAQPAAPTDPYKEAFVTWTDANLASKDSYYNTITMKDVRAKVSGISQVLDQKLDAVVRARGTPQSAQAIKDYLQVAIAGVQARSQELKNKTPQATMAAMGAAQAASGNVRQAMAQSGVNPTALKSFGTKLKSRQASSTNNPELDAMLADMGVRVS
jgi:hypothetical protein